jgi:signal transduction histidine kinase
VYYEILVVTLVVWSYVLTAWWHRTSADPAPPAGSRLADPAGPRLADPAGPRPAGLRGLIRARGWGLLLTPVALAYAALAQVNGGNHLVILAGIALTGIVMAFFPRLAAKIVPYGLLVLGVYGLMLAKWFHDGSNWQVLYGPVLAGAGSWRTHLLLPQAAVFFAAGLWLLLRVQAPGAEQVRALVAKWRYSGRGGIVPAQRWLLLPVVALLLELLGPRDWFGTDWITGAGVVDIDIVVGLASLVLVFRSRVWAATLAEAGLLVFGVYGLLIPVLGTVVTGFAYGLSAHDGTGASFLISGLQGVTLLTLGLWLVPRVMVHLAGPVDPELAARAQQLTQRVESLTQTRSDAVDTAVSELRRIERDLHDGAQARLVALGMSLQAAERLFATSPAAALALVTEAKETSSRALADLRDLVRGIYPPVLADRGLADAIRALALDSPLHTVLDIDLPDEVEMPVASAVYFSVAEALANVSKHASARSVRIQLNYATGMLRAEVTDDGAGGADPALGTGLTGVERRLATFDGILAVSSPPGGPTIVVIEVPCALSSAKTSSC